MVVWRADATRRTTGNGLYVVKKTVWKSGVKVTVVC